jgi:integrase
VNKFRFSLFRAKRRDGALYPKWRIRYFKDGAAILSEIGYTDKGKTEARAKDRVRELEHKAHLQSIGASILKEKPLADLVEMWLGELSAAGGKQNMPASPQHVFNMRSKLAYWVKALKITSPRDVGRAEALSLAHKMPFAVGTQETYIQALKTFLGWCVRNEYLARNPLAGHRKQAEAPTFKRRALTVEEALRLIAVTTDRRAMIYKTALLTGMRRAELDSLTVGSVDWTAGKVSLEAKHSKNRKAAEFYLPVDFLQELYAYCVGRPLSDRLFLSAVSPSKSARTLHRDLGKAGILVETAEGRIDFHSLRVTFLTWVNELGEDVKTVQELGRHADPRMTFGIYTKAKEERIRSVVTRAGARLLETNRDIPRLGNYHAGVTRVVSGKNILVGQGLTAVGQDAHVLHAQPQTNPAIPGTSADIKQAKAEVAAFFETATNPDIAGQGETGDLSRRRHALLSQVTEALSRLPQTDLEAILAAIQALGQGRATA